MKITGCDNFNVFGFSALYLFGNVCKTKTRIFIMDDASCGSCAAGFRIFTQENHWRKRGGTHHHRFRFWCKPWQQLCIDF